MTHVEVQRHMFTPCSVLISAYWKSQQFGSLTNVRLPALLQVLGQTGIGALALRLNHILVEHIRALLPSLRAHLEEALERRQKELKKYGAMPPGSTSAARSAPSSLDHF